MGDIANFCQIVLDQTDEGLFRVMSQHQWVTRNMEFTLGQPFIYNCRGLEAHNRNVTADHSEDGMVFTPGDGSWKMSFVFDNIHHQLTLRSEVGLTLTFQLM